MNRTSTTWGFPSSTWRSAAPGADLSALGQVKGTDQVYVDPELLVALAGARC
ncbi:MAG TPA: hypothetical protein VNT55_22280 [Baekduia sp.]|nr:hypothetical protein [Baekduia sp.]